MADKDTLMEEFVATEAAKNEDAAKDLERVEQQAGCGRGHHVHRVR